MNLGTHLPFFIGGVLVFRAWQATDFIYLHSLGWALLFTSILLTLMLYNSDQLISLIVRFGIKYSIWAIVFVILLLSVCYAHNPILESRLLRNLGKLSFSLYLLHPMIMVFLIKVDFPKYVVQITDNTMANFLIASIITIGLVYISSALTFRFIEAPGIQLGKALAKRYA
jgi:peptidoglycan/LPS O-acetylase OafA/YrhL